MKKRIGLLLLIVFSFFACSDKYPNLEDGLYAEIETEKGTILVALEFERTPVTVANFVTLAEGNNEFVNEQYRGKPFYDGLKFHRVIDNFMIQGGDPLGNGTGNIGYEFKDEICGLNFDNGGVLAMANGGPATNGSQFFITHVPTPDLYGKHTVFGHVVGNEMEVVNAINQDDVIVAVKIIRKGEAAKKFNAVKVFNNYFTHEDENIKKQALIDAENNKIYAEKYRHAIEEKVAFFNKIKTQSTKTKSGVQFKITQNGGGKKPKIGAPIYIHYAGFLEDGTLFDTSVATTAKSFGTFDQRREDARGYMPIPFQAGAKEGLIPGFIEGIENMSFGDKAVVFIPSELGYGAQGTRGIIPPNANLIFELELLESMPNQ